MKNEIKYRRGGMTRRNLWNRVNRVVLFSKVLKIRDIYSKAKKCGSRFHIPYTTKLFPRQVVIQND